MADLSDTQIRSQVQQVLARHRVDMGKTNFLCTRGVLRMLGEVQRAQETGVALDAQKLEALERELDKLRGVKRIQYDFANWRRTEEGGWREIVRPDREPRGEADAEAPA